MNLPKLAYWGRDFAQAPHGMSASRKGLKRYGMRGYIVKGPNAIIIIDRERPWRFAIRRENMPAGFYMEKFRLLREARDAAGSYAGVNDGSK